MLKRNLTMLIGVGLLGANVNFAAAAEGPFPPSSEDIIYRKLPAQEQYFAQQQRAASKQAPSAAGQSAFPRGTPLRALLPAQAKYLEQQAAKVRAASAGERTVKATAATKYLNVEHEEIVRIENEKGQSFVWKADTLGEADLPLQAIAPRDFAAGQTRVFVRHPLAHTSGN